MTVDDYLRSVGKKCFIDYYELFKDLDSHHNRIPHKQIA